MKSKDGTNLVAHQTLRDSEARFRELFENAHDIIYTHDLEGRLTSINKYVETMLGYAKADCVGVSVFDFVPPEYHPRIRQAINQKLANVNSPTIYEIELIRKDGVRVPVEINSRLITQDGRPVEIQGIARDMSERKRAAEALRSMQEQLHIVTTSMAAPVTRCTRDLRYSWVSQPYAAWLGKTPEQIAGRPIVEVIGPHAMRAIQPHIDRVLAGERVEYEEAVDFAGPGLRWVHAVYTPTLDSTGKPDGWVAVVNDVTSQKRAEETLRIADRRKDEFLAILAHELRNPLAPLRNALEVMRLARGDADAIEESRQMMERQLRQMVRLIDDLLDVSRITRGKLALQKQRVELASVIQNAVETSLPVIESAGHRLAVALPPEPICLEADLTRLAQVFANLLNNAAKFTPRGGRITLTTQVSGDKVVIAVRDTGIGIAPEHLPRLFDMFTQVTPPLDREHGGLGIGLSLAHGLVEMHGGRLEVESDGLGKGSEFRVRLPLSAAAPVGGTHGRAGSHLHPRKLQILVVDDNTDAAASLAYLLQLHGHTLHVAHDGIEALRAAEEFRPDVLLLDIGLPRLNGYEVAEHIRAASWGGDLTLIAVTGWGQDEDKRRASAAGFNHHMTKPVDPGELQRLLARLEPARGKTAVTP